MPIEYKAMPAFTMGIEGRTVTGIFCVHGNVDEGDGWSSRDRSHPGLFGDFTANGRARSVHLWMHNSYEPPIASIDQLFEVARGDLPPAVLKYAPDTTGGCAVKRTYLETPRGNEVLAGLTAGAIREMSYAYEATRWDFEKGGDEATRPIRNLYQANLMDTSDVTWGMNPATSADGSKGRPIAIEHAAVLAAVKAYIERYQQLSELRAKEGRVLSGDNRKRIESAVEALASASKALEDLLEATEPQKNSGHADTNRLRIMRIEREQRLRALGVTL